MADLWPSVRGTIVVQFAFRSSPLANLFCRCHCLKQLGIGVVLIVSLGCKPKNQNMLVAYVGGDLFLPRISSRSWVVGETKACQIASRTSIPPDKWRDLLLCGSDTQLAWSQTWLRADIKKAIYEAAGEQAVSFDSSGHSSRFTGRWWECRRIAEGISCD